METASPTEQFVGEGVPAFFHVEEPDVYHFERRFEDTRRRTGRCSAEQAPPRGRRRAEGIPLQPSWA